MPPLCIDTEKNYCRCAKKSIEQKTGLYYCAAFDQRLATLAARLIFIVFTILS